MAFVDSVQKIIERYFSAVTLTEFRYRGKVYTPKDLRVSPGIFVKRMNCLEKCGACCTRFSLDYIPREIHGLSITVRDVLEQRVVEFSGRDVMVWSDTQTDHENHHCKNLMMGNGRCGIHGSHPFSCDFELLRFSHFEDPNTPELLNHRPFGRAWAMKKIDGERGALCEWYEVPCEKEWIDELCIKLDRLEEWADHFGLETTIPRIISWVRRGPHVKPLIVGPKKNDGGFDL